MNELANLADALGADIEHVRRGIGSDPRIGYRFLYPGAGYGGSCFPKDVKALQATAGHHGRPLKILAAVEAVNDAQKKRLLEKINATIWPRSRQQDVRGLGPRVQGQHRRHARSAVANRCPRLARSRRQRDGAYDPVAMDEARRVFGTTARLAYAASPMDAVTGADALVVVTEWQEFRSPDFSELKRTLRQPLLFDGRNLFDPEGGARRRTGIFRHRPSVTATCNIWRVCSLPSQSWRPDADPGVLRIPYRDNDHAGAGGRRRDARSLLVRRCRAHLARGAGAGGSNFAQRRTPGRRGECCAQRRRAGRQGNADQRHRRRRAGTLAGAAAR